MSDERSNADILRAAKERIADQGHFVMGEMAWDRRGRSVDPLSEDAWRWNARGAIYRESGVRPTGWKETRETSLYGLLDKAARAIAERRGDRRLIDHADNLGHMLTLRAFDDAIAAAEKTESETMATAS